MTIDALELGHNRRLLPLRIMADQIPRSLRGSLYRHRISRHPTRTPTPHLQDVRPIPSSPTPEKDECIGSRSRKWLFGDSSRVSHCKRKRHDPRFLRSLPTQCFPASNSCFVAYATLRSRLLDYASCHVLQRVYHHLYYNRRFRRVLRASMGEYGSFVS